MKTKNYRLTLTSKFILLELFISITGLLAGMTMNVYSVNKKWNNLIYPNVTVSGINLGGKTFDEGLHKLQEQVITPKMSEKLVINAEGKSFTLDNSSIFSDNNAAAVVKQALDFGKDLNPLEKVMKLKASKSSEADYLNFNINDEYIKNTIKLISSEINRPPENASIYIDKDGTRVIKSSIKGVTLNEEKLQRELWNKLKDIHSYNLSIEAPVDKNDAQITESDLSKVNTEIASYSTSYYGSPYGRAYNIELAAKLINGKLIMPGESFSFNDTVGERTIERGFMEAPVLVGSEIDSGVGGGICQVSSTLYNAILNTGINYTERIHHTLPSSYVPLGQDATVDWNNIDFKFTNTLDYPIYIQAFTENQNIFVKIFSDSKLTEKRYTVHNDVYETIAAAQKVIDNPYLPTGETIVTQQGYQGYKVRIVRYTWENNSIVNTEVISEDTYVPVPSVVSRGVG